MRRSVYTNYRPSLSEAPNRDEVSEMYEASCRLYLVHQYYINNFIPRMSWFAQYTVSLYTFQTFYFEQTILGEGNKLRSLVKLLSAYYRRYLDSYKWPTVTNSYKWLSFDTIILKSCIYGRVQRTAFAKAPHKCKHNNSFTSFATLENY